MQTKHHAPTFMGLQKTWIIFYKDTSQWRDQGQVQVNAYTAEEALEKVADIIGDKPVIKVRFR